VEQDGYDRQIDAIVSEGEKAFKAQDSAKWRDAYENIDQLYSRLEAVTRRKRGDEGGEQRQDPAQLLITLGQMLVALEKSARQKGRYEEFESDFETLSRRLKGIDPKAGDANAQIYDWYYTGYEDLRKRLDEPEKEEDLVKIPK
jgi:hypothetical protein